MGRGVHWPPPWFIPSISIRIPPDPLVGGVIGLWLAGLCLSVPASVDFIALFGVVHCPHTDGRLSCLGRPRSIARRANTEAGLIGLAPNCSWPLRRTRMTLRRVKAVGERNK
ncbi:hypothetical protein SVA_3150 [Sulfurifustis variabilis]|uniref:Uncharacterized protein n=1 Tax=Sulfurifustis variabilis TaxID=1675686 RepID=A0A1C7AEU8_9GAMM|nr:hypothetical protein SVA_3150 [Sulfurifustis variabilis]